MMIIIGDDDDYGNDDDYDDYINDYCVGSDDSDAVYDFLV
jgi:hypothetical protein